MPGNVQRNRLIDFKSVFRRFRPLKHAACAAFADIPNNTRDELSPVKRFDICGHGALNSLVIAQIEGVHVRRHLDSPQADRAVDNFHNRGPEFNHIALELASGVQAFPFFFLPHRFRQRNDNKVAVVFRTDKRPSVISPFSWSTNLSRAPRCSFNPFLSIPMIFPLRHTGLSFTTNYEIIHIDTAVKRISFFINELQLRGWFREGTHASQVPVGLLAHQMGVFVGVDIKLLVKSDPSAMHGIDVLRGFGEKIKFV